MLDVRAPVESVQKPMPVLADSDACALCSQHADTIDHLLCSWDVCSRILGTLGFIRGDAPSLTSRVVLHSGPGGSLLGSKCQSRHVGASTNRLVGTAGWLDVVEGKKQLAERSESPVAQLLSIIMDEARARQWDLVGYRHLLGLL